MCEDLALVPETLQNVRRIEAAPDDLDRHFLVVLGVIADCEVHRTHSTATNLPNNAVEAQVLADEVLRVEKTGGDPWTAASITASLSPSAANRDSISI